MQNKKYFSVECKDDHNRLIRLAGKKAVNRGTINAALLENSERLQRVARYLADGKPHTTRDIILACDVCAVNSIVDELRDIKNGFDIICQHVKKGHFEYTMIGGLENLLRIV